MKLIRRENSQTRKIVPHHNPTSIVKDIGEERIQKNPNIHT